MSGEQVLIVEDDAILVMDLMNTLEKAGYGVQKPVPSGEEAIVAAAESPPALILMDIRLSGIMSGIEAAQEIRKTQDIPVVYVTANADDNLVKEAIDTGPYAYLVKPVQSTDLLRTIEVVLFKHRMNREVSEAQERYESVVALAMEGIILFDKDSHTILEVNEAFQDLFGYTREDLKAMKIPDLMPFPPEVAELLYADSGFSPQCRLGEQKFRRKDNSVIEVECNSSLIRSEGKNAIICVIVHDVTERKRAENALSEANRKLNLLGSITRHDLLNQLMAIRSYTSFIKESIQDPVLADLITKEEKVIGIMERQISFTRDYQDMGVKRPAWQNVAESVKNAAASLPVQTIKIDTGPQDLEVYADPLFAKVFYNLIDNALRHGGEQLTTLRVSSRKSEGGLIIYFEDDGVGIPPENKDLIFEHGFGKNTGLGLFLVREILGITGMTIGETSDTGRGARFEIAVPEGAYRFGTG